MSIRDSLTRAQRCEDLAFTIDPGFVHRRKIETIIGDTGVALIDEMIAAGPRDLPEWMVESRVDRIYTKAMLEVCRHWKVRTLQALMNEGKGLLFCSVENFGPCPTIWEGARRGSNSWIPPEHSDLSARIEYSIDRVRADTLKSYLAGGHAIALVGEVISQERSELVIEPIIMGAPWIQEEGASFDPSWLAYDFYENFIEDFDEFSKVRSVPLPPHAPEMEVVSEAAFKACLADILGGETPRDWGGETSDLYAAHMHLNGKSTTAAFLLKGPAGFRPMSLNHLGKNNDQIYRLSQEPAQVLIVQHCHDILPAVRATLRVFAVQPGRPRRYCLIDGRDSLRLLQAYGLLDKALSLSR